MSKILPFLKHHSVLIGFFPVGIATAYTSTIEDRSAWYHLLNNMMTALLVLMAAVAVLAHQGGHCSGCPVRTERQYRRFHLRLWNATGRFSPAIIGVFLLVRGTYVVFNPVKESNRAFALEEFLESSAVFLLLAVSLSSYLFYRAHQPQYPHKKVEAAARLMRGIEAAGHYSSYAFYPIIAAIIGVFVFTPNEGFWDSARFILSILLLAFWGAQFQHSGILCERCATELPVDAPEYAEKRKVIFYTMHKAPIPVFVLTLGCFVGMNVMYGTQTADALRALQFSVLVGHVLLIRFHSRYRPWCPVCHPGRGDGREHSEVPDPSPDHGKPLPV